MDANNPLLRYKKNYYSQYGEDGIIEKIFKVIKPSKQPWCVEFGAWDGVEYSNTYRLMKDKDWSGVFIEPNKKRFGELQETYSGNEKAVLVNSYVGFDGKTLLDRLLSKTDIPRNYDLLSIDIDGNDYHIWKDLKNYSPRVVAIEYNPTIPPEVEFIQEINLDVNQGSSLLSLYRLAKEKGYELVGCTETNAFFVKRKYYKLFNLKNNHPVRMMDRQRITHFFQLYDGSIVLEGNKRLIWHGIEISNEDIQVLPKPLRKFPTKFNIILVSLYKGRYNHVLSLVKDGIKQIMVSSNLKDIRLVLPRWVRRFLWRLIGEYKRVLWKIDGESQPPPHIVKVEAITRYAKDNNINILVETGTYLGDTIDAVIDDFKEIYSIELDKELFKRAVNQFINFGNVKLINGDSSKVLGNILVDIKKSAIFWLDAHYSGKGTAKGKEDTPVKREVELILKSRIGKSVILIDDARLFTGRNGYPELSKFIDHISRKYNKKVTVKDDIIRICHNN